MRKISGACRVARTNVSSFYFLVIKPSWLQYQTSHHAAIHNCYCRSGWSRSGCLCRRIWRRKIVAYHGRRIYLSSSCHHSTRNLGGQGISTISVGPTIIVWLGSAVFVSCFRVGAFQSWWTSWSFSWPPSPHRRGSHSSWKPRSS